VPAPTYLGFSATSLSWAQNAYTLTFGGVLLPGAVRGARSCPSRSLLVEGLCVPFPSDRPRYLGLPERERRECSHPGIPLSNRVKPVNSRTGECEHQAVRTPVHCLFVRQRASLRTVNKCTALQGYDLLGHR
jgi:hypothetical protein